MLARSCEAANPQIPRMFDCSDIVRRRTLVRQCSYLQFRRLWGAAKDANGERSLVQKELNRWQSLTSVYLRIEERFSQLCSARVYSHPSWWHRGSTVVTPDQWGYEKYWKVMKFYWHIYFKHVQTEDFWNRKKKHLWQFLGSWSSWSRFILRWCSPPLRRPGRQVARSPGRCVDLWLRGSAAPRLRSAQELSITCVPGCTSSTEVWSGQGAKGVEIDSSKIQRGNGTIGKVFLCWLLMFQAKRSKKNKTRSAVMMCSAVQRSLITCAYMIIHVLIKSHLGKFTSCLFCLPAREWSTRE